MKIIKKIGLDHIRFIASLLIIAIHIYPLATINENLDFIFTRVLFRIAVPIFLIITGFFIIPKSLENKSTLIKYTKKILKIYLLCILIYLPINIYSNYFKEISLITILKDILINGTFYHLWYFPALILGLWITYIIVKKLSKKQTITILIILYLIGLLGDSYYGIINKIEVFNNIYNILFNITSYTRNGLFYTPIFLYIGYYFNTHKLKISTKTNIILLIISLLLMLIEGTILHYNNLQKHSSMYILLIPTIIFLFNLLIPTINNTNKFLRTQSMLIYIIHPLIIIAVRLSAKIIHQENLIIYNNLINYILVTILSIISSIILIKVKEVIKNANNQRKERNKITQNRKSMDRNKPKQLRTQHKPNKKNNTR